MAYVPLRKAQAFLGLGKNTLRKYADEGAINSIKNEAGQRLHDVESYQRQSSPASTVCYCRVSSPKQRDDLQRQIAFMQSQYPGSEVISDIGNSGLESQRTKRQTQKALSLWSLTKNPLGWPDLKKIYRIPMKTQRSSSLKKAAVRHIDVAKENLFGSSDFDLELHLGDWAMADIFFSLTGREIKITQVIDGNEVMYAYGVSVYSSHELLLKFFQNQLDLTA